MQILASALPGFRDLRAPLTAGYLWLLLLWIVLKPDLTIRPTKEIARAVYDLGKAVGPIWIGLAISVAAYLLGSVSQSITQALYAAITNRFGNARRAHDEVRAIHARSAEPGPRNLIITKSRLVEIEKLQLAAFTKLLPSALGSDIDGELERVQRDIRIRAQEANGGLAFELNLPATLLIGKEHELFTEADRLKAESDLRVTVALPLMATVCYLMVSQSFWWAAALTPVAILVWQGYVRNAEFKSLMLGAVHRGVIQSQSVEEFKFWVSNLPPDGRPPTAERPEADKSPVT